LVDVLGLKGLLGHEDEKVKLKAEGALWILEEKEKETVSVATAPGAKNGEYRLENVIG